MAFTQDQAQVATRSKCPKNIQLHDHAQLQFLLLFCASPRFMQPAPHLLELHVRRQEPPHLQPTPRLLVELHVHRQQPPDLKP